MAGGNGESNPAAGQGLLGTLLSLLVAEKSGFEPTENGGLPSLKEFAERMTREALESMKQASANQPATALEAVPAEAKQR
jgi:hypothetical protein